MESNCENNDVVKMCSSLPMCKRQIQSTTKYLPLILQIHSIDINLLNVGKNISTSVHLISWPTYHFMKTVFYRVIADYVPINSVLQKILTFDFSVTFDIVKHILLFEFFFFFWFLGDHSLLTFFLFLSMTSHLFLKAITSPLP